MVTMMLGMIESLTMNVIADIVPFTKITVGGNMALGLGVVIRNDFRYGDDVEAYLKLTVEKLALHYPEYELVYDQDRIGFINKDDEIEMDLLLASGFWYVINEFAMLHLHYPRDQKLKEQTYRLAKALDVDEVWYCDEYVMDSVELKYTFWEFKKKAMHSGIIEFDENDKNEHKTTFFHEVIKEKYKSEYSLLIMGSVEIVKTIAARYGVNLVLGDFAADKGYVFEVEEDILGGHPFVQEIHKLGPLYYLSRKYAVMHIPGK